MHLAYIVASDLALDCLCSGLDAPEFASDFEVACVQANAGEFDLILEGANGKNISVQMNFSEFREALCRSTK